MGGRFWAGIPSRYVTSQLGQLSLASLRYARERYCHVCAKNAAIKQFEFKDNFDVDRRFLPVHRRRLRAASCRHRRTLNLQIRSNLGVFPLRVDAMHRSI